ncbi:MAG: immunity 53 family protein [Bacteroidia bacterium]|nr:immunity 53 family protein [Bacteroidia bacterium]
MQTIEWISSWFQSQCDDDWEHENQIIIETTSNPGWYIVIDLTDTECENLVLKADLVERDENDWYFYDFENAKFTGAGDLMKLEFLLDEFRKVVERFDK